ncbi:MAG TPA: hypothetical protein VJY64_00765 [Candidatus Onthovivens sp.]|nr:hypothetical protein [Candidatus Onthovivens sp.]
MNLLVLFELPTWTWIFIIIVFFAVIGLTAWLLHKVIHKNQKEEKPNEEKLVDENLNKFLEDVEDPETQKQIEEYEKNNKKEDK